MKNLTKLFAAITILVYLTGCDVNEPEYVVDNVPPVPPTGIKVFVGDDVIDLTWFDNRDPDLAGYNIYFSHSYNGIRFFSAFAFCFYLSSLPVDIFEFHIG